MFAPEILWLFNTCWSDSPYLLANELRYILGNSFHICPRISLQYQDTCYNFLSITAGEVKRWFDSFLLHAQVKDPDNAVRKAEAGGLKGSGLAKVFSAARAGAWWLLMQVFKVLLIIKAGVQALFQTLAPEKVVASLGSAIQKARERLIRGIVRSPPAIWTVLYLNLFPAYQNHITQIEQQQPTPHSTNGKTRKVTKFRQGLSNKMSSFWYLVRNLYWRLVLNGWFWL